MRGGNVEAGDGSDGGNLKRDCNRDSKKREGRRRSGASSDAADERRDDASVHSRTSNAPSVRFPAADVASRSRFPSHASPPPAAFHLNPNFQSRYPNIIQPFSCSSTVGGEEWKTYLLHMNNIIPILHKLASDRLGSVLLAPCDVIGVEDGGQAGDVHGEDGEVAGGCRCGSGLRDQGTVGEGGGELHLAG